MLGRLDITNFSLKVAIVSYNRYNTLMTAESRERNQYQPSVWVDHNGFAQPQEAFAHILAGRSAAHEIKIKMEIPQLRVVVNGFYGTEQTVTLEALGTQVTFPRSTARTPEGISVSADPDWPYDPTPARTINIQVGTLKDPDLDRGLAWIIVDNPENPRINFYLKEQEHTEEKLRETFSRVTNTAMEYLMEAFLGNLPIEHSQK